MHIIIIIIAIIFNVYIGCFLKHNKLTLQPPLKFQLSQQVPTQPTQFWGAALNAGFAAPNQQITLALVWSQSDKAGLWAI